MADRRVRLGFGSPDTVSFANVTRRVSGRGALTERLSWTCSATIVLTVVAFLGQYNSFEGAKGRRLDAVIFSMEGR